MQIQKRKIKERTVLKITKFNHVGLRKKSTAHYTKYTF